MAERTPRLLWNNLSQASATALSVSSAQVSFPVSNLRNAFRARVWRTPVGWTIVEGFNDSLDFTENTTGDATATIATGEYANGAALATAITTALNAAATDNTYLCTYDTSTKKFTIARATGSDAFGLEWSTGTNANAGKQGSIALDLGFDDSADDTGATSYTADNASYQSRHFLLLDLGSTLDFDTFGLVGHNVGTAGEVRRQGHASDAWTAPSLNATTWDSTVGDEIMVRFDSSTNQYRYARLVFNDVQNDDGFLEVGVFFVGEYLEPDRAMQQGHAETALNESEITSAYDGALQQQRKNEAYSVQGNFRRVSRTTRDALLAMEASLGVGGHFLFAMDPQNYPTAETYYGVLTRRIRYTQRVGDGTPSDRYDVAISFREALA